MVYKCNIGDVVINRREIHRIYNLVDKISYTKGYLDAAILFEGSENEKIGIIGLLVIDGLNAIKEYQELKKELGFRFGFSERDISALEKLFSFVKSSEVKTESIKKAREMIRSK